MPPANMTVQDEEEDKMASEYSLWLPRTVVKRHRKRATIIWVSLIIAFVAYISFIVWDTVDSRRDPAASFQVKQEVYTFPDVAVCMQPLEGCLATNTTLCLEYNQFFLLNQYGFMNTTLEIDDASLAIQEAFPACKVLPASKLEMNETGVENGDINHLVARFAMFWAEDPLGEYAPSSEDYTNINTQFVSLFFLNVDDGVEAIGKEVADVKLPYERVHAKFNETMVATTSHVVMDLTEFQPISAASGRKAEPERTYTQSTTTTKLNWIWDTESEEVPVAVLLFDLFIPKFEYTRIEEVDPVDAWAIIGAIGGVWQFVVIGFGLFFVFSEKQLPDKKMRNFRKTVVKPASIVNKRLSSVSSRGESIVTSTQDVVVDASDEDLPVEWVKKQRKDGRYYYCNEMTGAVQANSPHNGVADATAPAATRPKRGIARMFKPAHGRASSSGSASGTDDGPELSGVNLPPGWRERKDGAGKTYYVNTVLKTTQWERPKQRAPSDGSSSVQAVYAPMENARRSSRSSFQSSSSVGSNAGSVDGSAPPPPPNYARSSAPAPDRPTSSQAPSYRTMMALPSTSEEAPGAEGGGGSGGAESSSLPPGWELRTTVDGKTYYANTTTKVTQWRAPHK